MQPGARPSFLTEKEASVTPGQREQSRARCLCRLPRYEAIDSSVIEWNGCQYASLNVVGDERPKELVEDGAIEDDDHEKVGCESQRIHT